MKTPKVSNTYFRSLICRYLIIENHEPFGFGNYYLYK